MRPKNTTRTSRWSQRAGWSQPLPPLRAQHGAEVAELVEWARHILAFRRDQPRAQDITHTLHGVAEHPETAEQHGRVDDSTAARLAGVAWRDYGARNWRELPAEHRAACARVALAIPYRGAGRPRTDDIAVELLRGLMLLPNGADREMLLDALLRAGIGGDGANLDRLLKLARKHAG